MQTARVLVVFADYVCPFSYLSLHALERAADGLAVTTEWRAFELRPSPAPLREASADAEWLIAEQLAAEAGIVLTRPTHQPRTRKAHEATKFAATVGMDTPLRRAIFVAHFAGRDIGRIDVLVDVASSVGIDPLALKVALDVDAHTDDVAADAALAHSLEIEGTPAFVAGGDVRIGYLSVEHLRDWLKD